MKLSEDICSFFEKQGIVIVSSLEADKKVHCSIKSIVGIEEVGKIYIIDLYKNKTYKNLKLNPIVSITAIDEHSFKGYTMQGKAKIVVHTEIEDHIVNKWEEKIIRRISARMIKSIQKGVTSKIHHEAELPHKPKYLIEIDVEKIIDLSPPTLRNKRSHA